MPLCAGNRDSSTHPCGNAFGDGEELFVGQRHHRVRGPGRRPHDRMPSQRLVDDRAKSGRMPRGCDASDRLMGSAAHQCRLALVIDSASRSWASKSVSTRCAPLAMTSSGLPSHSNTRLLAIAPTSHPSCSAAAAAVLASPSRIVMSGSIPTAASAAATLAFRGFTRSLSPPESRSSEAPRRVIP
jgi:hypothetical protein